METIPKNNVDTKKQKTSILFQHVQNIPRYEWKDPKAFEAMLKQQPIVITKTNLAGKGLEKWYDLDYLGENMSPSAMFHTYFCEKTFGTMVPHRTALGLLGYSETVYTFSCC